MSKKMHVVSMILLGIFIGMLSFFISFSSAMNEMRRNMEVSQSSSESGDSEDAYLFKSVDLLNANFEMYGKDMGFESASEYGLAATAVLEDPDALHKTAASDGIEMYYIENTNEYVEVSADGYIRKYFKPEAGKLYYDSL